MILSLALSPTFFLITFLLLALLTQARLTSGHLYLLFPLSECTFFRSSHDLLCPSSPLGLRWLPWPSSTPTHLPLIPYPGWLHFYGTLHFLKLHYLSVHWLIVYLPTGLSALWGQWLYVLPMTSTASGQSRFSIEMWLASGFESRNWGLVRPECGVAVLMHVDIPRLMERKRSCWSQSHRWKGRMVGRPGAPGGCKSSAVRWEAQLIGESASWRGRGRADQSLDQHCIIKLSEILEMLQSCAYQHGSHQPQVAIKHINMASIIK